MLQRYLQYSLNRAKGTVSSRSRLSKGCCFNAGLMSRARKQEVSGNFARTSFSLPDRPKGELRSPDKLKHVPRKRPNPTTVSVFDSPHRRGIAQLPQSVRRNPASRPAVLRANLLRRRDRHLVQPPIALPDVPQRPIDRLLDDIAAVARRLDNQRQERRELLVGHIPTLYRKARQQRKTRPPHELALGARPLRSLRKRQRRVADQILARLVAHVPGIEIVRPAIQLAGGHAHGVVDQGREDPRFVDA